MKPGVAAMGLLSLLGLMIGGGASRAEGTPRDIPGVARLDLPAAFEGGGAVDEQPAWGMFQFSTKRVTDWGGYSHYRSVLLVTVFAPDATADDMARGRAEARRRLHRNLEKASWLAPAGASPQVGEAMYSRNYEEPVWLVWYEDRARRVDLDLVTWKKAHSREAAVRLLEESARTVVLASRLPDWFAEIRDRPRREAEAHEQRIARLRDYLARRGFPPLVRGQVQRHADYVYELRAAGWPLFAIGRLLGSLGPWSTPQRPFDLEYPQPAPSAGQKWPPLYTRERAGDDWRWGLGPSHLLPDALTAAVAGQDADPRVVYFYTFETFALNAEEPEETARGLDAFLASAPRMAEAFRTGQLVRARPFR